jgi:hypothetical protein
MLQPKIGDIVIIQGVVKKVFQHSATCEITTFGLLTDMTINNDCITEIVKRSIRAGDTVHKIDDVLPDFNYTVLAVHQGTHGRRWAICAHKTDGPQIFNENELTCVD